MPEEERVGTAERGREEEAEDVFELREEDDRPGMFDENGY
jgi:hypothetical protein